LIPIYNYLLQNQIYRIYWFRIY